MPSSAASDASVAGGRVRGGRSIIPARYPVGVEGNATRSVFGDHGVFPSPGPVTERERPTLADPDAARPDGTGEPLLPSENVFPIPSHRCREPIRCCGPHHHTSTPAPSGARSKDAVSYTHLTLPTKRIV